MYDLAVFAVLLSIVVGGTAGAWLLFRHDRGSSASTLGVFLLLNTFWSVTHLGTLTTETLQWQLLFTQLSYVGVVSLPVVWLVFALRYADRGEWLSTRRVALLSVVPATTLLVVLTVPWHRLFYTSTRLVTVGTQPVLRVETGPWYHVNVAYSYALLLAGTWVLAKAALSDNRLYRRQSAVLVACIAVPWVVNVSFHLGVRPIPWVDPTPMAFVAVGVVLAGLVVRTDLASFLPVAHERIFRTLDDPMLVVGPDGTLVDANDAARSVLRDGRPLEGADVDDVLPAPLLDGGSLRPGRDDPVECTLDDGDHAREYLVRRQRIDPEHGAAVRGRLVVMTDVTERRERERQLERARDRYRAIVENDQFALWEYDLSEVRRRAEAVADDAGDVAAELDDSTGTLRWVLDGMEPLDVNGKAVEFYEADSKDHLLDNAEQVMTEESMESLQSLVLNVLDGETSFRASCRARTLAGATRHVILEVAVPETYADTYDRVFMIAIDVTERRERERELRRKNEFLDEFASVVSHDVATPLSVIENKARLVEMTGDPSHAADIHEASERVRRLVDQLRELARQGKEVGETGPVELEAVVREAWRSIDTRRGTLRVESSTTLDADADRLRQALANLLQNAVEHGATCGSGPDATDVEHVRGPTTDGVDRGGAATGGDAVTVRVGTCPSGFYVADDGPGVAPDHHDRVFEQGFTTGDDSSGLGLAIVRRVVEGHGWSVEVTESEEGGARFEVRTDG